MICLIVKEGHVVNKIAVRELKASRSLFFKIVFFSFIGTLAIVGQAAFFAELVNKSFLEGYNLSELYGTLLSLILIIAVRMGSTYWQEHSAAKLAREIKSRLRERIVVQMLRLGNLRAEKHGEVIHLLTDGLENVEAYVSRYVPQMLLSTMIPLIMAIAIIDTTPWVAVVLLVTFPLIPYFMILIGKKAESMNKQQWERMSFLSGHFLDILQGIATLQLFGRAKEQTDVIARLSGEFRDSTLKVLRVAFLSALVLELVSTISTALIAVYMGMALLYDQVAFQPAFFVLLLAPEFYAPLRQLGAAFHTGMAGNTSLEKIDEFLALSSLEPISGIKELTEPLTRLQAENIYFTYEQAETPSWALQNISFSLRQGESLMLVGESGAGKSTLAGLFLKLAQPQKGRLTINDVSLEELNTAWWRRQIAYVPQQVHLFKGTIRENIAFYGTYSLEEIQEAAVLAEADSFIQNMPQGYDTVLGEGGGGLSGGERQRIALARAFLKNAPIIIFDELSAHLDVAAEEAIDRAVMRLIKDRMAIFIGHRLHLMSQVDRLAVMKGGQLVEYGTYRELMGEKGYFSSLVKAGIGGMYDKA